MSYINEQNSALVRVKLTDMGRKKLASGQLSFVNYAVGDSEVDYNYVEGWAQFAPSEGAAGGEFYFPEADGNIIKNIYSKVLRPKDQQPNFSSFLLDSLGVNMQHSLSSMPGNPLQLIQGIVSNEAADRGFFSGSTVAEGLTAVTTTDFIKESGTVDLVKFDGAIELSGYTQGVLDLDTALTATTANDYIMFRLSNCTLGSVLGDQMTAATINAFYNIVSISGTSINVDRPLPTLSGCGGTIITYYTFPGGDDPMDTYYGLPSLTAYWDTTTLSFNSSCDICVTNIPVWNMNNVWTENMAGLFTDKTGANYHSHDLFGSEQYAGTKRYLGYDFVAPPTMDGNTSQIDPFNKSIAIIHYTNSCISNFYGEFFNIDEDTGKLLNLDIPVMWHKRNEGTGSGTTLGMTFVSDTTLYHQNPGIPDPNNPGSYLGQDPTLNASLEFYELIEASGMTINNVANLEVVGKVFPQLKIVVIENEELVAAMSYKSNRNYTLPDLRANLTNSGGNCTGCLHPGEMMYLTYWLENTGTTTTPTLPRQRYTIIENLNTNPTDTDIEFYIDGINQLPYMRKTELGGYDGLGFFADRFNLLCQKVPNWNTRPDPSKWRVIDFTSTLITGASGETINPLLLEAQNASSTGFLLTGDLFDAASGATSQFNLGDELDMSSGSFYGKMTFGDERLFYGNLRTYVGATIYKTLFNITIDGSTFVSSTNPTYIEHVQGGGANDRFVSEVGIYDQAMDLVLVGKLSRPIRIKDASTATIELVIDF